MRNKGFTATEMIIVLAIVGLIAAFAVSSIGRAKYNWTLRGEANKFVMSIYKAKSMAMKEEKVTKIHLDSSSTPSKYYIEIKDPNFKEVPNTENIIPSQAVFTLDPQKDILFLPDGRIMVENASTDWQMSIIHVKIALSSLSQHFVNVTIYPLGGIETSRHFVK